MNFEGLDWPVKPERRTHTVAEGKAEGNQSSTRQGATFRTDALDKVTGETKYIEDLPDLPGTVYAATLRSPYSDARILSIDS